MQNKNNLLSKRFAIILITHFSFISIAANAQVIDGAKKDSLMLNRAIYWTKKGENAKAKTICQSILKNHPDYFEAEILMGKLYSWESHFDSARIYLNKAFRQKPTNEEVIQSLVNVELWAHNFDKAYYYCEKGLQLYPQSENLLIKKAKILAKQEKFKESIIIIDKVLKLNPNNQEALKLTEYLKKKSSEKPLNNEIGISFSYDHFTNSFSPWTFMSLYYLHKSRSIILSGAINYANRFNSKGLQYELNAYPKISSSLKGFFGVAYSSSSIYAEYYIGAGVFYKPVKHLQIEGAVHYLNFKGLDNPLIIYSAGVNISIQNNDFGLKTYLSQQQNGLNQSYYFIGRHYFNNKYKFISITLNTGLSPHDYIDPITNKVYNYPTHNNRIKLAYQTPFISHNLILKCIAGYENRKYQLNTRNRITAGLGFERLF